MHTRITRLIGTGLAVATIAVAIGCSSNPVDSASTNRLETATADLTPRQVNWLQLDGTVLEIDHAGRVLLLADSKVTVKIHEDAAVYYDDNTKPLGIAGIFSRDQVRLLGDFDNDLFLARVVYVESRDAGREIKTQ